VNVRIRLARHSAAVLQAVRIVQVAVVATLEVVRVAVTAAAVVVAAHLREEEIAVSGPSAKRKLRSRSS
jgi:hypothetical protein